MPVPPGPVENTPDRQTWRGGLDLADGDRGGVTSCLVGRRSEIGERRVRGVTGIDSERVGVSAVQSFDERLGGKCAAAGRAGFDARPLVDFVAEGGDFATTGGEDAPDVQRRTPVEPEPK